MRVRKHSSPALCHHISMSAFPQCTLVSSVYYCNPGRSQHEPTRVLKRSMFVLSCAVLSVNVLRHCTASNYLPSAADFASPAFGLTQSEEDEEREIAETGGRTPSDPRGTLESSFARSHSSGRLSQTDH